MSTGGDPGTCIWKFENNVWTGDPIHCNTGFKCQDEFEGQRLDQAGVDNELFQRMLASLPPDKVNRIDKTTVEIPCVPESMAPHSSGPASGASPQPPPRSPGSGPGTSPQP
jgi:hypothetical protein